MESILQNWLGVLGLGDGPALFAAKAILVTGTIVLCVIAHLVTKGVVLRIIRRLVRLTRTKWDDILSRERVFARLAQLTPAVVAYLVVPHLFPEAQALTVVIQRVLLSIMIAVGLSVFDALLAGVVAIYSTFPVSKSRPIKGYVQLVKVFIFIVGAILIITTLIDKSPLGILSGIGAMTAVILLVFRDSILGFVAGFQLSTNQMVKIGDWIEMKKYEANGFVEDVTLQSIKVRNWDNTLTMIPIYALISDSFINWQGMLESGGRRIQRSLFIDMNSVRFCTPEVIERLKKVRLLRDYLGRKEEEIRRYNEEQNIEGPVSLNGRWLTNLGTFRAYIWAYLSNHPYISREMLFLVRYLQPGPQGLPIEIYVFCTDIGWVNYEGIQADILDHLLAVVPEFGLRIYQQPGGHDLQSIADALGRGLTAPTPGD